MKIKVMKFGGTSVAGIKRIIKVASIIEKETKNYKIIVKKYANFMFFLYKMVIFDKICLNKLFTILIPKSRLTI